MTSQLRKLLAAATPAPWGRETVGHENIAHIAGKVAHDLSKPLPDGIPPSTDATWVVNEDASKTVAFVGNGPKQTDNGELIVYLVNNAEKIADLIDATRVYLTGEYPTGTEHPADWRAGQVADALAALEDAPAATGTPPVPHRADQPTGPWPERGDTIRDDGPPPEPRRQRTMMEEY